MSGSSPLDVQEINSLVDELPGARDRAAILLSSGCGLRAGTLCALKLANVLDREHRLTGRIEIDRAKMKGKRKPHTVTIPARALRALAEWIAIHPAPHRAAPLFASYRNPEKPITTRTWRRIVQEATQRAGITKRVSTHSLRKFYAHAIYKSTGNDIELTTRALGNKSPMATMHYLDFGQRKIDNATMEIFNDAAQPALPGTEPDHPISIKTPL